ncbi:transcription factor TGA2-like protein [Carex littledalei]|uniref:Transcription factor TGA2-like protein n=1 Tax=Carex littledalei TaxID=544730 RepID=A0A833VS86_9POAL|nr:transcription factor TGA2-like protein [Carex littledalei]
MERGFVACYENWMQNQKSELTDLLRVATMQGATEMQQRLIMEQCMQTYENYMERRRTLAREDGPTFFCPPWCTSFENSVLFMGGCRPSLMIRLIYTLTGCEMEAHLEEFLQGQRSLANVGLMNLTPHQLHQVNELHQRTLRAEDRLSSRQATQQEDIADKPLFPIVRERQQLTRTESASTFAAAAATESSSSSSSSPYISDSHMEFDARENGVVHAAMKTYADSMAKLVEEADALRLATAKKLVFEILSTKQAVELLIAGKQLHLSVHDWGKQRDLQNGRG